MYGIFGNCFSLRPGTVPEPHMIKEESDIENVFFSSDNKMVAVSLSKGSIIIRDACTGGASNVLQPDLVGKYMSFCHIEGAYVLAIAKEKCIEVWRPTLEEPQTTLNTEAEIQAISLTSDCRLLASALVDGPILVWDIF